jgi:hypothetical protein
MDLLGNENQDMTSEQVLKFVEAKEAGKRSASRLLLPQATDAVAGSSYKRQKRAPSKGQLSRDQDTCTYCGTKGHGRNPPTRIRRTECPAFGARCNCCSKEHHFEKMCRNRGGAKPTKDTEHEGAISDTLCEITSADSTRSAALDHHIFNQTTNEWLRRRSRPQPYVRLHMSINKEDYDHFGFPLKRHRDSPSSVPWRTRVAKVA